MSTFKLPLMMALPDGEVSELHVGLKGTMDALELKKIAEKTWRGAASALGRGHIPGGIAYGYALAPRIHDNGRVELSLRAISEEQAAIVRRIFAKYVSGRCVHPFPFAPREVRRMRGNYTHQDRKRWGCRSSCFRPRRCRSSSPNIIAPGL